MMLGLRMDTGPSNGPSLSAEGEACPGAAGASDPFLAEAGRFRALIENSLDAFALVTPQGQTLYLSPSSERIMGYSEEDLKGQNVFTFAHPDDLSLVLEKFKECASREGAIATFTCRARHKAGGWRWLEVCLTNHLEHPAIGAVVANYRDVTQKMESEQALRRSEARNRAVLEASLDPIITIDPEGRVMEFNQAAERTFGYEREFAVGRSLAELVIPLPLRSAFLEAVAKRRTISAAPWLNRRFEVRAMKADGTDFPAEVTVVRVEDERGFSFTAFVRDLTQRSRAESELRRLSSALEQTADAVMITDRAGVICYVNAAFTELTGYTDEDAVGSKPNLLKSGLHAASFYDELWRTVISGKVFRAEFINRRKNGGLFYAEKTITPIRNPDGEITHFVSTAKDISERKRSQSTLAAERSLLRTLIDNLPGEIYIKDREGRYLINNLPNTRFLGAPSEREVTGKTVYDFFPPEIARLYDADDKSVVQSGQPLRAREEPYEIGEKRGWFSTTKVPLRDADGHIIGLIGITMDITERKQNEEIARRSELSFRTLVNSVEGIVWEADAETFQFKFVSQQAERLLGYPCERWLKEPQFWQEHIHPDDREWTVQTCLTATRQLQAHQLEYRMVAADGRSVWLRDIVTILKEPDETLLLRGVMVDITEWKRAEEALRESEVRFRQLAENINEVFWVSDPVKQELLYVSPAYEKVWGRSRESLQAARGDWRSTIHPQDLARIPEGLLRKRVKTTHTEEYRIERLDGTVCWVRESAFPVRDAHGDVYRIVGVAEDITERRELEAQLRQSQKMEAIGQLAGGVAHDFNNILTAILMQTELASGAEDVPQEVHESLKEIKFSAERAANLTRQLLAFSRRQVMQARPLDLNEVVLSVVKMLERILGEDIRIELKLHRAALPIQADLSMIDQLIMNLAVNARDAMPEGGRLAIETSLALAAEVQSLSEAAPGKHVRLTVTDTGCGIAPEHLPRIFDPFFTTKEIGKGTGLGLATVFGIVKQHSGCLRVQSEVGKGATFVIYLPASEVPKGAETVRKSSQQGPGGSETILLVEDEAAVRTLARSVLVRAGYCVLEAANGFEALRIWEKKKQPIHLLLTDLVMPAGLSGRDLAADLLARASELKVVFTSGYSAEIAGKELNLAEGQNFIPKPFSPPLLLEMVRRCLDA